jgi:hypothetical protein
MGHHEDDAKTSHPDLLRLDAIRAGEGTPEEEYHLERCRHCRDMLDVLRTTEASLRRAAPPAGPVPPEIDRAVFEAFRRASSAPRKTILFPSRPRWLVPAIGTAAAAVLVLVLAGPVLEKSPSREAVVPLQQPAEPPLGEQAAAPVEGDINGDGKVDILDAFQLARILEDQEPTTARQDINRDGRVNLTDVDAVARRAVAL